MAEEDVFDQFVFDRYVNKCLSELKNNKWTLTDETIAMFKALVIKKVNLDSHENELKAHLMIIINSVIRLSYIGLEDNLNHLEDVDRTEILQQFTDLQESLVYLYQSETSSSTLKDFSRICLFETYVLLVKVISLVISDETEDTLLMKRVLERMESVTNFQSHYEKSMYKQCERVLSQSDSSLDCPPIKELWSQIRNLVLEAALSLEVPSECPCQLECKIYGEKSKERLKRISAVMDFIKEISEVPEDEEKDKTVREKSEQIQKKRHQEFRDTSGEQLTPSVERKKISYPVSKSSTPRKRTVDHGKAAAATSETSCTSDSGSSPEQKKKTKKYPPLQAVKARESLLMFGNSRKPPSHTRVALGKWLKDEEEEFIATTLVLGEGKWAEIKAATKSLRSNVQLKDKWRQIPLGQIQRVARNHDLVYRGSKTHNKS